MTTPLPNSPHEGAKLESAGSSVSRRNLLVAGATAAITPAIGTGVTTPVAAQAQALPQRFGYPANREVVNAARARALESLLIEKGIITGKSVDGVLSFFETQMGPFNGAKVVARAWVDRSLQEARRRRHSGRNRFA